MKKTEFDYLSDHYDKTLKDSFPKALGEVNYFSTYKVKLVYELVRNKKKYSYFRFWLWAGNFLKNFF